MKIVIKGNCCKKRKVRLVPTLGPITEQSSPVVPTPQFRGPSPDKRYRLMAFSMTATQQCDLTIAPVDKKGNPAKLDGVPEWSTDNTDVLALTPSGDGLTCTVAAVGPLTSTPARVTVTGDADMGSGTTPIIGFVDVTITAGSAVTINITPQPPIEQP